MIKVEFVTDDLPCRWYEVDKGDGDSVSSLETTDTRESLLSYTESQGNGVMLVVETSGHSQPQQAQFAFHNRCSGNGPLRSILKTRTASGCSDEASDESCCSGTQETRYTVCFNLKATKVHNRFDCFEMSEREFGQSYYSNQEVRQFHADALADFEACCRLNAAARNSSQITRWLMTTAGKTSKFDIKETVRNSFSTCERAKSEKAMKSAGDLVHREALAEIYSFHDRIIGMEKYILQDVREQSKQLCQVLLDYELKATQGRRRRRRRNDDIQDEEETLKQVSQAISRPSRIFAHEVAKAIAASLW